MLPTHCTCCCLCDGVATVPCRHGPNELRCNGPLSNIAEFIEAFGVVEGDAMHRVEAARVDIW